MRLFSAKKAAQFSPWKIVIERMENGNFYGSNAEKVTYNIYGVSVLDYLDLYKKFTYINQESYKLDHIASVELGMKKLDYSEYNSLHLLYKNNFEKFIDYNSRDVDLIIMLEEKMKLIELAITMSYDAKINFDDVFSQVRMWDVIIYNYLLGKNIVIPPKKTNSNNNTIEGAYVKEPLLGQHDWVVSFDLTSLYPHLIMMYNISPETLLPESINATTEIILNKQLLIDNSVAEKYNNNFTIASNGRIFSKQFQGFMPELMEWMFDRRKKFKTQMLNTQKLLEQNKKTATSDQLRQYTNDISKYNNLQMAMKIALNSAYGAMGNPYFRYFDVALAEAVTKSGQTSIRWIENKLNMYFNKLLKTEDVDYIIAVDTDSVYIKFNSIVDTFIKSNNKEKIINTIDKICNEKLTPYINSSYSELSNYVLALPNKMIMKRESIADRGIWTAKKRYILNVHDSEGVRYSEPKLKIMGIEAVRSSTPGSCRANIKEALKIIMNKNEDALITFISDFKERFKTLPVEDIAFPRTANNISKYAMAGNSIYKSGTPIHIRGSLIYNKMLKKLKLTNTYQEIYNGEKIKFVYLKQPNVLHDNVISFKNTLPVEFNIHDCIDYDLQFEKTFIDPLSVITNIIGWNYERTDRKSTRLNSSHSQQSRMPSSA